MGEMPGTLVITVEASVISADPGTAFPVFKEGYNIIPCQTSFPGGIFDQPGELLFLPVEKIQTSIISGDPEIAGIILKCFLYKIGADGVAVGGIVEESGKGSLFRVKQVESSSPGSHPELPVPVLQDIQHRIGSKAFLVEGIIPVMVKDSVVPLQQVQPAPIRPDPDIPGVVFTEGLDIIVPEAVGPRFLPVEVEFLHTRRVDIDPSPMGADPDIALVIFKKSRYGPLGKTIGIARLIFVVIKGAGRGVEQVEASVDTAGPQPPQVIGEHTPDHVAAETGTVLF